MSQARALLLLSFLPFPAGASSGLDGAERLTLHSKVLGEERVLAVVTPAGYARSEERYPVLYLTDGDAQMGHARATAEFLARNGLMPPVVLVGILNTDRTRDLTPTRGNKDEQEAFPTAGGGERFLDFIEQELVPAVDARYRTVPLRLYAGHSLGGLLGVHALFSRPGLFRAVVAASPSLLWDDALLSREARAAKPGVGACPRALFLTLGGQEAVPLVLEDFQEFARAAKAVPWPGFTFGWQVLPGEDHGSVVLPGYYAGLRHIFADWRMSSGALPASVATLQQHYQGLSERWGYRILAPEAVVNALGYRTLNHGATASAIEVFRLNVATHPESPNVHDALGEALERDGQLSAAGESYRRAVQLAEDDADPLLAQLRAHLEQLELRLKAPGAAGTPH
jgi:predicted alpha/beta superfamily hydrolase